MRHGAHSRNSLRLANRVIRRLAIHRRQICPRRAFAELLESRRLLATLVVNGGSGNDDISISVDNNSIYPLVNGIVIPQPRSLWDAVTVNGLGGSDNIFIQNTRSEPIDIFPGDGGDTVRVCATGGGGDNDLDAISARVYVHAGTDATNDTLQISDSLDIGISEYDVVEDGPMKLRKPDATLPDKVFWGESNLHTTIFMSDRDDTANVDSSVVLDGTDETLTIDGDGTFGASDFTHDQRVNFSGTISNGNLFEFLGSAGDNTLVTIGDVFAGAASIKFDGGPLGNDLLTVNDTAATNSYNFNSAGTQLTLVQGSQTGTIQYSHVATIALGSTSATQASTFNIDGADADLIISAAGGADTFVVGDGAISTTDFGPSIGLTLDGGSGADSILFNDLASGTGRAVSLDNGVFHHENVDFVQCSSIASATISLGSSTDGITLGADLGDFTSVFVNGGLGADSFTVSPVVGTAITLNGQGPGIAPGDQLHLLANGATGGTLATSSISSGTYSFPGRGDIDFTGMESFTQPGAGPTGAPNLQTADDTGRSVTDNVTKKTSLIFSGLGAGFNNTVRLFRDGVQVATGTSLGDSSYVFSAVAFPAGDATFAMTVTTDSSQTGLISDPSPTLNVRVDTVIPAAPPAPDLDPASDSGKLDDDNITNDTTPQMIGTVEPVAKVHVLADGITFAFTTADVTDGSYAVGTSIALSNGFHSMTATQEDLAGNVSNPSGALGITIDTVAPAAPSTALDLEGDSDSGLLNSDNLTNVNTPTFIVNGPELIRLLNGTTILADYAAPPNVTVSPALSDGVYSITARSVDLAGNVSTGQTAALQVTIDTVAPAAPSAAPDLQPGSDSGVSNSDNITRVTMPAFTVNGPERIRLSSGTTILADYAIPPNITVSTALADGQQFISARSIDLAGNVSAGKSLNMVVDTKAPTLTDVNFTFQTAQSVNYKFSEDVSPTVQLANFALQNLTTPTTFGAGSIALSATPGNVVSFANFTFPGFPAGLPDGNYRATLTAVGITDLAGNPLAAGNLFDFFVLAGDANGDRTVGFADLVILAQHYNQAAGATFGVGDFNYDGAVGFADLVILAQRYNTSLPPAAAPVTAQAVSANSVLAPASAGKSVFSIAPVIRPVRRRHA